MRAVAVNLGIPSGKKGDDIMNYGYLKLAVALALAFAVQGCVIFIRDRDYDHYYRNRRHHSSLQQPDLSADHMVFDKVDDFRGSV